MGDNRIVSVGNVTMPLMRVKVGIEVVLTKKENRDKANRRGRNIKGIEESKRAKIRAKFNSAHANSGDRVVSKTSYGMWFNQVNGLEVQQNRRNMTGSTSVDDERKRRMGRE